MGVLPFDFPVYDVAQPVQRFWFVDARQARLELFEDQIPVHRGPAPT